MFSENLIKRLKSAYNVTVLTGAGISSESGVPTFRGKDGLWEKYSIENLATNEAFYNNTEKFWEFYNWRRSLLKNIKPNLGHYALVEMEAFFDDFSLITQNVDGLHELAGNKNVINLHGSIKRNRCDSCGDITSLHEDEKVIPPDCKKCGGKVRPDVILFGEKLNDKVLRKAQEVSAECEVFFSIGTSSLVEPAASLPYIAKGNGAYIVEINPEKTPLSDFVNEAITKQSSEALKELVIILDRFK